MKKPASLIIVIFGASGDLTKRKLMPALYLLYKNQHTPASMAILGLGRTSYDDSSFQAFMREQLSRFVRPEDKDDPILETFIKLLHYQTLDPSVADDYQLLKSRLQALDAEIGNPSNYLYYLATPPSLYGIIPQYLKGQGLNKSGQEGGFKRIIVEKPFGYDLESARELTRIYKNAFEENQIFRIDHFLGKETVQNILAFRFSNSIFEPLWNRNYIDYVEITAVENTGIENRGGFFDQTGTLRDMAQNHLSQLLAITAMEPPSEFNADSFRNELLKVYQAFSPLTETDLRQHVIRGQYTESDERKAYRQEEQIDPKSRTETFLAMKIGINNWRWNGVPFYLRTGKQMPTKASEIVIHFKKTPYTLFRYTDESHPDTNRLIIRIQPNEGIALRFSMKVPGSGFEVRQTDMNFSYDSLGTLPTEDAYARLIEDCMEGDSTLFTRDDVVEASWKFFDPILNYWKEHPEAPLYGYPAGTWGPPESNIMMKETGASWTNPCKNLTNTDLYCEL